MLRMHLALACMALMTAAGCSSMVGKWTLADVSPGVARGDFPYESLTLHDDGSFYGQAREAGGTKTVSGTWTLADGVLLLEQMDGERHAFNAEVEEWGDELELLTIWEGKQMVARFDKADEDDTHLWHQRWVFRDRD